MWHFSVGRPHHQDRRGIPITPARCSWNASQSGPFRPRTSMASNHIVVVCDSPCNFVMDKPFFEMTSRSPDILSAWLSSGTFRLHLPGYAHCLRRCRPLPQSPPSGARYCLPSPRRLRPDRSTGRLPILPEAFSIVSFRGSSFFMCFFTISFMATKTSAIAFFPMAVLFEPCNWAPKVRRGSSRTSRSVISSICRTRSASTPAMLLQKAGRRFF